MNIFNNKKYLEIELEILCSLWISLHNHFSKTDHFNLFYVTVSQLSIIHMYNSSTLKSTKIFLALSNECHFFRSYHRYSVEDTGKKIFYCAKRYPFSEPQATIGKQFPERRFITAFSRSLNSHFVYCNFVNHPSFCGTRQFRSRFPLMNIGTRTQFGWKQGRKLELRVIELLALERASRRQAATLGQHEKTVCSLSVVCINNIRVHHFEARVCSWISMYLIHR